MTLQEVMKAEGLEVAEESVKAGIKAFIMAAPKLILASENKYDDMLIPLLAIIEPALLDLAEQINKADNQA